MRFWRFAIPLTAASCTLLAQQPDRFLSGPPRTSREYLTAAALAAPDGNAQIEILFRCPGTSLVALRSDDPASPFLRKGELTVELFDSAGTSHARDIERIEIPAQDPDTADTPLSWIERRISFHVPPGRYEVRTELQDLQSRNRLLRNARVLPLPPGRDSLRVVPVFFVFGTGGSPDDTLHPQNFGDGILFASRGGLLLQLPDADSTAAQAAASVRILVQDPGESQPTLAREVKATSLAPLFGRTLSPAGTIEYVLRPQPAATSGAFLLIPLPLEELPLRRYRMECHVSIGAKHATVPVEAQMIWPDMPESLRDVEYAIESLRFIAPEGMLDSLQRGSFEERRNKLERYWKQRDATPETADNPIMTEYYRRVDEAREQFATLKQRDGTRTDRGRIFVLNGPPSHTERMLDPVNGFTETWTYDRTRKRFVFLDKNRDGNYALITSGTQ